MRKVTIVVLVVIILGFVGGKFYLDRRQESEAGYKDGLKMGYLYGFNDAKAGSSPKTESLRERLVVEENSIYEKALLQGAREGYLKGYQSGKETE